MKPIILIIILFAQLNHSFASEPFPLRSVYPAIETVSAQNLAKHLTDITLIDVRDQFEFEVIHITGAVNIPLSAPDFIQKLNNSVSFDKPVILYCNGHQCRKSYEAARQGKEAGLNKLRVYDGGMLDWLKRYPHKSVLLGSSPIHSEKIISDQDFLKRNLGHEDFVRNCAEQNRLVIDIRNHFDTRGFKGFAGNTIHVSADRLIPYLEDKVKKSAQLCFFDSVGKQVRWLQYHLNSMSYENYFFLLGGARSINSLENTTIN